MFSSFVLVIKSNNAFSSDSLNLWKIIVFYSKIYIYSHEFVYFNPAKARNAEYIFNNVASDSGVLDKLQILTSSSLTISTHCFSIGL
jgi:hypothetical protein